MINFKTVSRTDPDTLAYWESIYVEAFPVDEQAPLDILLELSETVSGALMEIVLDDEVPVGILFMNNMNMDRALVLYLAMDVKQRGQGYGSKVLQALQARFSSGIILETEMLDDTAENAEQRERRYRFYQRNGMQDSEIMSHTLGGVFHLMRSSVNITMDDYLLGVEQLGPIPGIPTFVFNKSNLDSFMKFTSKK